MFLIGLIIACSETANEPQWQDSGYGFNYKFFISNDGPKPKYYDIIISDMMIFREDSSIMRSTFADVPSQFTFHPNIFNGALNEAIKMVSPGDSVIFQLPADSIYSGELMNTFGFAKGEKLNYLFKIYAIQDESTKIENDKQLREQTKKENIEQIKEHLTAEELSARQSTNGLFYIEDVKGNGKRAQIGDNVEIYYTMYALDGSVLESYSREGKLTVSFTVGNSDYIKALEESVQLISEGGKGRFYFPATLGFYDLRRTQGKPLQTAPLKYEIELVKVTKNKS